MLLSGGAGLGKFHYGIVKALWECDLIPKVLCGTSAGALVASYICVFKREELSNLFQYEVSIPRNIVAFK